jgi:lipid II:glycine glycyltransferase (peptidoglycan interpeptide bridge formation enzyme)
LDSLFGVQSIYIEIFFDEILVGGYRFIFYESKKLPSFLRSISRSITFFGEAISHPNFSKEKITALIDQAIAKFIREQKPIKFKVSNYYGEGIIPSVFSTTKSTSFDMAIIRLDQSEEELWDNVHSKHRNSIRKAEKSGVYVALSDDIDTFIALMKTTYESQEAKHSPNYTFIKEQFQRYAANGNALLYLAFHEGKAYNGALVTYLGEKAYYAFAGTIKNPWAAGNLTQWFIIKDLKARGLKTYSLGQVAIEGTSDFGDDKFISGITTFKMRFGPSLIRGISGQSILRPFANTCWSWMVKLITK